MVEVIRKYMDVSRLMTIMQLPKLLRNRKLEVIIMPAEDAAETVEELSEVEGIVKSLIGSIPDEQMGLSDYRAERLKKYEDID